MTRNLQVPGSNRRSPHRPRTAGGGAFALLLCAALGCSSSGGGGSGGGGEGGQGGSGGQGGGADERTPLRVKLYPYIPDAAGDGFEEMARRIEREFEQAHADVDLVVNPPCFTGDVYDPPAVAAALGGEAADCRLDLVEADMMLLGDLVETGALRPWDELPEVGFHPAAIAASTHGEAIYGSPRWLCSHFIFSRSEAVAAAGTVTELATALGALQTPAPDMAGNLLGSWNLPSLYLDAWADTNGPEGVASAVSAESYDQATLDALRRFARTCDEGGANPCIDGTYDQPENFDLPAQRFAAAEVDALLGYSERLHAIRKSLPAGAPLDGIRLSAAPLGEGNAPLLFTDSFVVSAACTGACAEAADAFVAYMASTETYAWVLLSEDAPAEGRVPRYVMPASLDVYAVEGIRDDPFFPTIKALTEGAPSFPNRGVYAVKDEMTGEILAEIQGAP